MKEDKVVTAETSTAYAAYSLVALGADGFAFKEAAKPTIYRYALDAAYTASTTPTLVGAYPASCAETATGTSSVAADKAACAAVSALVTPAACTAVITAAAFAVSGTTKACTYVYAASAGTVDAAAKAAFVMQQVSQDPSTYVAVTAPTLPAVPAIYGWMNDAAFFRLTWDLATTKLTATDIVPVPAKYRVQMLPEHVSFAATRVGILSRVNCAATTPLTSLVS